MDHERIYTISEFERFCEVKQFRSFRYDSSTGNRAGDMQFIMHLGVPKCSEGSDTFVFKSGSNSQLVLRNVNGVRFYVDSECGFNKAEFLCGTELRPGGARTYTFTVS